MKDAALRPLSAPLPSAPRAARPQPRRTVASSIDAAISGKVKRTKLGAVFTPALFANLGGRAAVDNALQRLVARGELRRLSRGLHDKPRHDPLLGARQGHPRQGQVSNLNPNPPHPFGRHFSNRHTPPETPAP